MSSFLALDGSQRSEHIHTGCIQDGSTVAEPRPPSDTVPNAVSADATSPVLPPLRSIAVGRARENFGAIPDTRRQL